MTAAADPAVAGRPHVPRSQEYPYHQAIPTRWHDNDQYGHLNNTIYYAAMDTAINTWLVREGGFVPATDPVIGVVAESSCRYHASASFPEELLLGVRIGRIGTTSVVWETGVFRHRDHEPLATGRFVHVFVSRDTGRPAPLPIELRSRLEHTFLHG